MAMGMVMMRKVDQAGRATDLFELGHLGLVLPQQGLEPPAATTRHRFSA
jgi:hypothetical protein